LQGLNQYLAEPIEDCLARDEAGNLCLEAKSPLDIETALNMPQGNIFHNALSWFFSEAKAEEGSWGVETAYERIYVCGSGARRGGAVSGIPGHNAAMKVLTMKK
jgi:phytoene dehydrogenase-like protein